MAEPAPTIDDPDSHVLMPTATLHMIMERLAKLEADTQALQLQDVHLQARVRQLEWALWYVLCRPALLRSCGLCVSTRRCARRIDTPTTPGCARPRAVQHTQKVGTDS